MSYTYGVGTPGMVASIPAPLGTRVWNTGLIRIIPSALRRLRTVVYIVVASASDSRRGVGVVRGGSPPWYTDCIVKFLYI